ncbi:hypothetical protein [Anaerorhabdus sp.]|uniref:hypothetical protein n=1 Tax=Anaerorhabdus sp. TaxID=1872524 RepID=UPI002FC84A3F
MIKTNKNSRFELKSLDEIRSCKEILLQIQPTGTNFTSGQPVYLCEVVGSYSYANNEKDLTLEIISLNKEKRELEKKVKRLERKLRSDYLGNLL